MADKKEKELTVEKSMADFRKAYQAKKKLLDRQQEDHKFALGEQWSPEDVEKLKLANVKPITDNRIAPNIHLLTGLERQNRTDFKAFPEGEEDTVKAEVASALFKNAIKTSEFQYKSSDQFKDGITCGESHLELYLDYTENLLNGHPCWQKMDGDCIFPEPGYREYDFRDCRYVYKLKLDVPKEDMINLFQDKKKALDKAGSGRIDLEGMMGSEEKHSQPRSYPKSGTGGDSSDEKTEGFDLIERYYKKWVETFSIGDKETGKIQPAEDEEKAKGFIQNYKDQIVADENAYVQALQQYQIAALQPQPQPQAVGPMGQASIDEMGNPMDQAPMDPMQAPVDPMAPPVDPMQPPKAPEPPLPPPQRNPERFILIKRLVPEIWCFAHTPGIDEPLANERAWFYPKWKLYPFVPYFARFSTAPLKGDDRHLLVQGIVHGVKGVQEKHNKAEMLMLRHLNSSANSGWDVEEGQVEDINALKTLGSTPGIVIERKKGTPPLNRLIPVPLSTGHAELAAESAEAIKAQLGINADLLATQQGGADSGRAIALRQKQGLLMIQELFDNLSRTRIIAGKFLLSQLGEIYDTESAKKVLGEAFLTKNFPPPLELVEDPATGGPAIDPMSGQPQQRPMVDPATGQPMTYDTQMAELAIAEVLSGELEKYDVSVGESVASESQKLANSAEVKEIATAYPGIIPPDILIEESQLPQSTKNRIMSSLQQAQAMAQAQPQKPPRPKADAA